LQVFGDLTHSELILLAPTARTIPRFFRRWSVDRSGHAHWLHKMQRVRGRIYLSDGALRASELRMDGRHVQRSDHDSWHLLAIDQNGAVQGCARYRPLTGPVAFDDLGVRDSWLARCRRWGPTLRGAVESEIVKAKQLGMAFSEVGGWAIVPEKRGTAEALRIAMATFSLARVLGGCVGISTATERHRSSSILRRIGGRSLEFGGTKLPSYYDPQYRCRMEVLRFDSRSPESSCRRWVDQLNTQLSEVPILVPRNTC
jgi:hypothetical protein